MRVWLSYLAAGMLVAVALDIFVPPSGLGFAVNAWSVVPPGTTMQYVDRTRKSDRLDTSISTVDKRPTSRVPLKMMDGCDPVFSPLSSAAKANFPGRCAV